MIALAKSLSGGLVGSPDTIRKKLRKFATSNVDQIILLNQAGNNTHEHICESLELFATEVMPEFHDMEPAHQDWKREKSGCGLAIATAYGAVKAICETA